MKVLITGAGGQLGRDLIQVLGGKHEVAGCSHRELDVTDARSVMACILRHRPDAVIHAAAYTKVDMAEFEPETAYRVNAYGTRNVAAAAEAAAAKMFLISTDYVFGGGKGAPYDEFDSPAPINIYGKSKLEGEVLAARCTNRLFVLRTAWLYGAGGTNYVRKMLELARRNPTLKVVDDEIGSPTYTRDLAAFLALLLPTSQYGIYHAVNEGSCSRVEFTRAIFRAAGLKHIALQEVPSSYFRLPAKRPANSSLSQNSIVRNGLPKLRPWQEALQAFIREELAAEGGGNHGE